MKNVKTRLNANTVVLPLQGKEARLKPARIAPEEARKFVRKYVPRGDSLVDELIAERRKEARREFHRG